MLEIATKSNFTNTLESKEFFGRRVISPSGVVVGHVKGVRTDLTVFSIVGITVSHMGRSVYIGREYIDKISKDAVLLKVEPFTLLYGMRVVTNDGKVLGRVHDVSRIKTSNNIDKLTVKSWFKGSYIIKASDIESYGKSIILKEGYDSFKKAQPS